MSQVKVVAHPTLGTVVTPSRKEGFGTIRVDSVNKSMENGYLNIQKRTAFIHGKMEDLESLGLRADQVLRGKIIKKESFEPFYEGQNPKINPTTQEVILTNGQETYLEYSYTEDTTATDKWVGSTSQEVSEEVENALASQATGN